MISADEYRLLEKIRWGRWVVCPHCGSTRNYFINARLDSERRMWKCAVCRKQFTALTGTPMERSKLPIRTWLALMVEDGSCRSLAQKYGTTPLTVSRVRRRFAATFW